MKSNSDVTRKPHATGQGQPGKATGNGYAPSVPITVYRELAAELQATKAMMESMSAQNQQLVRQNQLMRQEIERLMQSALTLQNIAGIAQPNGASAAPIVNHSAATNPEAIADLVRQATRPAQPRPAQPQAEQTQSPTPEQIQGTQAPANPVEFDPLANDLFTEIAEEPHRSEKRPVNAKDMGGFWLTATIAVIVITAFGAGFMVVRPLLSR